MVPTALGIYIGREHRIWKQLQLKINNTHEATIALLPSTMHPQSWAEPHTHMHIQANEAIASKIIYTQQFTYGFYTP